jgi:hypothetical protein
MDLTAVAGALTRLVSQGVELAGQPDVLRGLLLDELPERGATWLLWCRRPRTDSSMNCAAVLPTSPS